VTTSAPGKGKHASLPLFSLFLNFLAGHVFATEIYDSARKQNPAKVKELIAKTPALTYEKTEIEIKAQYCYLGSRSFHE